jgi:phthalate 4,5-cis-dihydrodiol dehydrogenase
MIASLPPIISFQRFYPVCGLLSCSRPGIHAQSSPILDVGDEMTERRLRLGVAGLGRAFSLMAPGFAAHPRVRLVAAADPRAEARARFAAEFGGTVYAGVEELCNDRSVDAVYVAGPHEVHAEHAILAAKNGKSVLVEKPMALTLPDCRAMIAAAEQSGVRLIVGHSHSFDAPIARARQIVAGGALGAVRMITAINYTDFLYRLRRPEELDTAGGGGVFFNQAPHQVDITRLLSNGPVRRVRAASGAWDPTRPTEGAYSALLTFAAGAFASLTYNGYGHFDSDEWCDWIGEGGQRKDPDAYGAARRLLSAAASPEQERALKATRNYGGTDFSAAGDAPEFHPHFGFVLVSCEHGDVRPTPQGVMVYGDRERRFDALPPPQLPRAEVVDELCDAVLDGKPPLHDGAWGLATMEVCLAMVRSAREGRDVDLGAQTGAAR